MANIIYMVAQAKGKFTAKSKTPKRSDPRAEEARRKALISESARAGRQASILTSGQGLLDDPIISKPVIMGTT